MSRQEVFVAATALALAPVFKALEFVAMPVSRRPDLLIVLAIAAGWSSDVWTAAPLGFALGLLEDISTGRALGARSISLTVAAVSSSLLKRFITHDSAMLRVIAALVSATAGDLVNLGVLRAMGVGVSPVYFLRSIWPATAAWSGILVIPLDFILVRLSRAMVRLWPADRSRGRDAAP